MTCPHCQEPLQMAERQGIEIDYCARCRGVWLDRGELDKILERAAHEEDRRPPDAGFPRPLGAAGHGDRGKHGRKRSLLDILDIFD